jgi:hypothetical protein
MTAGNMTHLELAGTVHGPPSEQIGHNRRLQDLLAEGGQPGTSTVLIGGDGARFGVEALVCVDFEHELALDGWNRWQIIHASARNRTLSGNRIRCGCG